MTFRRRIEPERTPAPCVHSFECHATAVYALVIGWGRVRRKRETRYEVCERHAREYSERYGMEMSKLA